MKTATKYVHAGMEPDTATGAIMTPIYQTSTFVQASPGNNLGYEYARSKNPTRTSLETALAVLEQAQYALAFSSGVAATDAILKLFIPGDEIITCNDLYGGSYRLFDKILAPQGYIFNYVDTTKIESLEQNYNAKTKLVWIETPTNPLMQISDIQAIANWCKHKNILLAVDNTFASPYCQNPLLLGAHIVMHSVTKYIAGHSDVIQGAVMLNDKNLYDKLYFTQKSCGAVPGPLDCFLVLRGIKTLALRMEAHNKNGQVVAHYLKNNPNVKQVYWCGFTDHPQYPIAQKQMLGFGGMISFELKSERIEDVLKFVSSTKLFSLAESLGGVESLINHPATMTHASIPKEIRLKNGLSDGLIRLSVGIEDADDLIADLEMAFSCC
ncbi:MAG: PLP-dependent aspartate aminotransferase family protein [Alphaproteobacteria bacterium]|nr:PLP-dependent aspartate aminotransferase family protein [Alphaproteobacteria bacterium]